MPVEVIPDRLEKVQELPLLKGGHEPPNGEIQMCVMEAVSFVAGEPWSDHPKCASEVIGAFLRTWNDQLKDEDRQRLKPYVIKLVATAASREVELKRSWMALDWLARAQAVAWLKLAKLEAAAEAIAALPEIVDSATARAAQPTLERGRQAAARAAAWAAAGDAAGAAAGDAARAAAWDAAWDAARDAAWAAAGAAARAAAWAAARDAARAAAGAALASTVSELQESAFELLDRMIAVGAD